jgi:hypothetical protein
MVLLSPWRDRGLRCTIHGQLQENLSLPQRQVQACIRLTNVDVSNGRARPFDLADDEFV